MVRTREKERKKENWQTYPFGFDKKYWRHNLHESFCALICSRKSRAYFAVSNRKKDHDVIHPILVETIHPSSQSSVIPYLLLERRIGGRIDTKENCLLQLVLFHGHPTLFSIEESSKMSSGSCSNEVSLDISQCPKAE